MSKPKWMKLLLHRFKSFVHAGRGLILLFQQETNAKIQIAALVGVVILCFLSALSTWEWVAVLTVAAMVLVCEALNSAIEKVADSITLEFHPGIRDAKDLAAGAVLLAAAFATLVGGIILIPKWIPL